MPYSNIEILSGALVVACLLLLYCWSKKQSVEGARNQPGLKLAYHEGYVPKPNYNQFKKREGYMPTSSVAGHLTESTSMSHFGAHTGVKGGYHLSDAYLNQRLMREGYVPHGMNINFRSSMEDASPKSLHELNTSATPASNASMTPSKCDTDLFWMSDGSIPENIFTRDGAVNPAVQLTEEDGASLVQMALGKASDRVNNKRSNPSVCGTVFDLVDTGKNHDLTW